MAQKKKYAVLNAEFPNMGAVSFSEDARHLTPGIFQWHSVIYHPLSDERCWLDFESAMRIARIIKNDFKDCFSNKTGKKISEGITIISLKS